MNQVINRNQLHYRGDHTDFDPDIIMGPDWLDSYYLPVSAVYDKARDQTTMTLRPLMPEDMREHLAKIYRTGATQGEAAQRLRELFVR